MSSSVVTRLIEIPGDCLLDHCRVVIVFSTSKGLFIAFPLRRPHSIQRNNILATYCPNSSNIARIATRLVKEMVKTGISTISPCKIVWMSEDKNGWTKINLMWNGKSYCGMGDSDLNAFERQLLADTWFIQ